MTELAAPSKSSPLADVRTIARYVVTHIDAGHGDPSSDKFDELITDLDTLVRNANRVRYEVHPPATIEERLSFLVLHADLLEKLVSQGSIDANAAVKQTQADITAAADRTIAAIGDVAALRAERDAALAAATDAAAATEQAVSDLSAAVATLATTQAALDVALADVAADATLNADTATTAQAASATATGIAPSV